jgi:methyl-accepting chemotaxis protein
MSIKSDKFGLIRLAGIALVGVSVASLAGCQEEPSAENAGEVIDDAADNIEDARDTIDDAQDDIDDAYDTIEDATEDINDSTAP